MKSSTNVLVAISAVVFSLGAVNPAFSQPASGAAPTTPQTPKPSAPGEVPQPQAPAVQPQAGVAAPQAAGIGGVGGFGGGRGRGGVVVAVPGAGGGGFGGPIVGGGGFGAGVGQGFVIVNGQLTPLGGPVDLQTQQTINGLATRLRQLKAHENPADDEQKQIADLTEELRQSLQVEFKQRQKFQLDEMAQLRDRLDNLQKEIVDRNKNRDSLLDQRLTDLLSGNAPAGPGQQVLMFQQQLQRPQPIQAAGVAPALVAQPANPAPPPAPAAPATLEDPVAPPKSHVK